MLMQDPSTSYEVYHGIFLDALCEYSLLLNSYTMYDVKAEGRNWKMVYSSKKVIFNYACVELPATYLILFVGRIPV